MEDPVPTETARLAGLTVRLARDDDSPGIVDLITRCFDEYPGCVMDLHGEEPGLLTPTTSFTRFWVVERDADRAVVGAIACQDHPDAVPPHVELKKLYVDAAVRGRGLARVLVERVEAHARAVGLPRIELWTDTRFETAHAVYARLCYERTGAERELHDKSHTREYHCIKAL